MTRNLYFAFLTALPTLCFAQTSPVKNAPDFSSWKVKIKMHSEASREPKTTGLAQLTLDAGPSVLQEIEIDKMGAVRREVYRWNNNFSSERWYCEEMILIEDPRSHEILVMAENRLSPVVRKSFPSYQSSGDFPEVSWVGIANFQGDEVKNGRPCHRYQLKATTVNSKDGGNVSQQTPEMIAWIDSETGMPVETETARETRTYTPLEARKAELPAKFRRAMDEYRKAFSRS